MRVRRPLGITEWADKYRKLSAKEASETGKYDSSRTPMLRAIQDALQEDHPAEIVDFLKPTQIGGTTIGQNWLGWGLMESPATYLLLLPTDKLALRWVRSKFRPMVRATPVLRRRVSIGQRKRDPDDDSTMTEIHSGQSMILAGSAGIGADLRMIPFRRLMFDEVDEYPREIAGQGDPVDLGMERFKTFNGRRKCYRTSTPTDDASRIARYYKESSQGECFVPCPHCGHMQTLEWENLRYTATNTSDPESCSDAAMACTGCGALIEEHHKTWMLERCEWRHRRPQLVEKHIGFRLNCLYTPLGLGDRWQDNARLYEKAKRDPAKMRAFDNTRLAIVHVGASIRLEAADLQRRALPYRLREIPPDVLLLTAGVDVQYDRLEVIILGWSRNEVITVIDDAVIPGAPTSTETFAELLEYLQRPITNAFGVPMRVECALVDSGNWQHEVTNFTRYLRYEGIFASKGSSVTTRVPIGRPTMVDVKYRGRVDQRGAEQYQLGVHVLKTTLYTRLRADGDYVQKCEDEGAPWDPARLMVRMSHQLDPDFYDQVTAEKFDADTGKYVKLRDRNEDLDGIVMAMGAAMHHS
ncbi:MAG TPA: terminase gpA endonuclease subunit, partial [Rhodanobacteraceae bacterium]|nr:terminase gpA endonuclease subunit [Rhodanobacteraceae bacterium]